MRRRESLLEFTDFRYQMTIVPLHIDCMIESQSVPDAGKDRRQEEKGMTEDEMVGWHYRSNGREFEQAQGVGDGQESQACCSPWGHKESDLTE